jgi:hypothetical protein
MTDDMHLIAEPSPTPVSLMLKTDDGRRVALVTITWAKLCWPEHCPPDELQEYEVRTVRDWLVARINWDSPDEDP